MCTICPKGHRYQTTNFNPWKVRRPPHHFYMGVPPPPPPSPRDNNCTIQMREFQYCLETWCKALYFHSDANKSLAPEWFQHFSVLLFVCHTYILHTYFILPHKWNKYTIQNNKKRKVAKGSKRNYRMLIRDKALSNYELRVDYNKWNKRWGRLSSLFITTH